jgi:tyrosine-protein kinase Etk/Wzc
MEETIQIQAAKSELSRLSVKDLFYKYIRFLPLFIISIALSLMVAFLYLRYATLVYQSTGTMVIQDDNSSSGGNDKFDNIFSSGNKKNILNEIEYIRSAKLMARVVKALDLNFSYTAIGKIKELNAYTSCPFQAEVFEIRDSGGFSMKIEFTSGHNFKVDGDGPFTFGQVFKNVHGVFRLDRNIPVPVPVGSEYRLDWRPTASVAAKLATELIVAPKQGTAILTLTLQSTNPQLAADVVNHTMAAYQKATIEDKNEKTRAQLAFIDKELDTVATQLDSINRLYVQFVKANAVYDLSAQSTGYLTQMDEAAKSRQVQQDLLNKAYQIESGLLTNGGSIKVPSSLGIEDPTLNRMVEVYNTAQLERKSLLETTSPNNIAVKQQNEIIDQLQKNILASLGSVKAALRSNISSIDQVSGTAESRLRVLPEKQKTLADIEVLKQNKLTVLNTLLEKREQSAIELAATVSNVKVLKDAAADNTPVKPNPKNTKLLAIVIGLILPALFIFLLELLNDKVNTRHDIERLTSVTVLGEVGHSFGKGSLVVTNTNRSVVAEQFRIIRSNLQYVLNHINKPVILVTSSFSGEGKSFISTNVGAVMALAGKKTIILEFDIRKPKVLAQLNIPRRHGLTNFLLGKTAIEDLPISVEGVPNLYVLPCGPVPPNPAEMLLDTRISDLFDWLRKNFDAVIMDTAPVGMVSDALTLSRFADATLYIVRQGHTFKNQIGMIDEFYITGKLPKMSIILNDVKVKAGYGYSGYGHYGYGRAYGSGYFQDDMPPPTTLSRYFGWLDTRKWNKKKRKKTRV